MRDHLAPAGGAFSKEVVPIKIMQIPIPWKNIIQDILGGDSNECLSELIFLNVFLRVGHRREWTVSVGMEKFGVICLGFSIFVLASLGCRKHSKHHEKWKHMCNGVVGKVYGIDLWRQLIVKSLLMACHGRFSTKSQTSVLQKSPLYKIPVLYKIPNRGPLSAP